jgi:hypothetical protein
MTVLMQNQATKTFSPFSALFDKSAKSSAADFPGPTQFFGPLVVLRPKFRPLGSTDY